MTLLLYCYLTRSEEEFVSPGCLIVVEVVDYRLRKELHLARETTLVSRSFDVVCIENKKRTRHQRLRGLQGSRLELCPQPSGSRQ